MKIAELRGLLGEAERKDLEKAFAECYKGLRKGQKEELDSVLTAILQGKETDARKAQSPASFPELKQQIDSFLENAYAGNYFAPNRVIPKSQRPKWRFMVKNFIKELSKMPSESEHFGEAVQLLEKLYRLICTACEVYLFSTDDAFRSIGWKQDEFYALLAAKTFANGFEREDICRMVRYAATGGLSRESLHVYQELILLGALKTSDVKCIAIEEAMKLVDERDKQLSQLKKYDIREYELREDVDNLCAMILLISIELGEAEKGMEYYYKFTRETDKEVVLYRLLWLINMMGEDGLWLEAYEDGLKKKIKPRDILKEEYEERKAEAGNV